MSAQPYGECVEKLLQPSRLLIQHMKNDGVDLSKERLVTHLLVGPDAVVLKASKLFSDRGFEILEASNQRLLLGEKLALTDEWVSQIVPAMCHKAEEFGLSYDGWDVDTAGGN